MGEYAHRAAEIIKRIHELKLFVRKYEEDEEYKEYVEGILDAAKSVLELITK